MRFEHPPIPFSTPVFGVRDGTEIEIHGYAFDGPHGSFAVEFFVNNDIALHLNPRMKHHGNTIVLNSMVYGQWQNEERHHHAIHHFHHQKHFHLRIKVHEHHFKITVDGTHICHFHHRLPFHAINMIGIRNDIVVKHVHFHHVGEGVPYTAPIPAMPIGGGVAPGYSAYPTMVAPPPVYMPPPQPMMAYGSPSVVVVEEDRHHHHHHGHHHHHHHCD